MSEFKTRIRLAGNKVQWYVEKQYESSTWKIVKVFYSKHDAEDYAGIYA